MIIRVIQNSASSQEINEMLTTLETYIKVAVDVRKGVLAGGGIMHADCEAVLIEKGSKQQDIWGANWVPETGEIEFDALINIRPRDNNRKPQIENPEIRSQVQNIIERLLGQPK